VKFVQEFDDSGWKTMHRLVLVNDDGTRIEGQFSLFDLPAFIYDEQIAGVPLPEQATSGWISTTDYFGGEFPRVARFYLDSAVTVEQAEVAVVGSIMSAQMNKIDVAMGADAAAESEVEV
jgi:hypothetical protein